MTDQGIDQPAIVNSNNIVKAIAGAASNWIDPTYPQRQQAVEDTLVLGNRFTEEAMAFAINQQMSLLTEEALQTWINGRKVDDPLSIGVLNAGNIPLVGLQDWLAVILTGHAYRGVLSSRSPHLLPAFSFDVIDRCPGLDIDFLTFDELLGAVDAVIASGSEETMGSVALACEDEGIPESRRLLRGHRYGVAVLSGKESATERENLAEDIFLHEGLGCRNVAIVWAPEDLAPDAYLEAFAAFRGVFPVHERTPGILKMKQAFLNAIGVSHAYGDGLEFLVSKGEPEQQEPGHVRWATYRTRQELISWIEENTEDIQLIVTGSQSADLHHLPLPVLPFGEAQRPALNWCADGRDTVEFLVSL